MDQDPPFKVVSWDGKLLLKQQEQVQEQSESYDNDDNGKLSTTMLDLLLTRVQSISPFRKDCAISTLSQNLLPDLLQAQHHLDSSSLPAHLIWQSQCQFWQFIMLCLKLDWIEPTSYRQSKYFTLATQLPLSRLKSQNASADYVQAPAQLPRSRLPQRRFGGIQLSSSAWDSERGFARPTPTERSAWQVSWSQLYLTLQG